MFISSLEGTWHRPICTPFVWNECWRGFFCWNRVDTGRELDVAHQTTLVEFARDTLEEHYCIPCITSATFVMVMVKISLDFANVIQTNFVCLEIHSLMFPLRHISCGNILHSRAWS